MKAVICKVGEERFALDVKHIVSIEKMVNIRSLPNADDYIAGIMHLRGDLIPVLDLGIWLGITDDPSNEKKQIIIVEKGSKRIGMIVDLALDVTDLEEDQFRQIEIQSITNFNKVIHMDDHLVLFLDVSAILEEESIDQHLEMV